MVHGGGAVPLNEFSLYSQLFLCVIENKTRDVADKVHDDSKCFTHKARKVTTHVGYSLRYTMFTILH